MKLCHQPYPGFITKKIGENESKKRSKRSGNNYGYKIYPFLGVGKKPGNCQDYSTRNQPTQGSNFNKTSKKNSQVTVVLKEKFCFVYNFLDIHCAGLVPLK